MGRRPALAIIIRVANGRKAPLLSRIGIVDRQQQPAGSDPSRRRGGGVTREDNFRRGPGGPTIRRTRGASIHSLITVIGEEIAEQRAIWQGADGGVSVIV